MRSASWILVLSAILVLAGSVSAVHRRGVLELDSVTFDKVLGGNQHYALVVFQEQSWKDPPSFEDVGSEFAQQSDILIAKVDGSANQDLVTRFGIKEFPTVLFFAKQSTPEVYTGSDAADNLIDFVRSSLDTKFARLKDMAKQFVSSEGKAALLSEAKQLADSLEGALADVAKFYIRGMENILKSGVEFVEKEATRLRNLVDNKSTTQQKKAEFNKRLNLLNVFKGNNQ